LAAGVFETVHFGVMDDAALLHALVVSAPNDFVIAHEDGADGNAAGGTTLAGFVDGSLKKRIHDAAIETLLKKVARRQG
jgi:hypothetical protein